MNSNQSRPVPPANGSQLAPGFAISGTGTLRVHPLRERRFDPFFRPAFDAVLRDRWRATSRLLINAPARRARDSRSYRGGKAPLPGEGEFVDSIIASFPGADARPVWKPGGFERGGNARRSGIDPGRVHRPRRPAGRAAPRHLRRAEGTYRAWVRFSGPGPTSPGHRRRRLHEHQQQADGAFPRRSYDERGAGPGRHVRRLRRSTFVTPDVKANAQLQRSRALKNATPAIYYFANLHAAAHPRRHHAGPLHQDPVSRPVRGPGTSAGCVPYLLGARPGDAVFGLAEDQADATPIPRLPLRPPRRLPAARPWSVRSSTPGAMSSSAQRIQRQTDHSPDADRERASMLLAGAAVAAGVRRDAADSAPEVRLPGADGVRASVLTYNPWHAIAEHRPLGNQSRARRRMYLALSTLRHEMNAIPHYEPTGDEVFDASA